MTSDITCLEMYKNVTTMHWSKTWINLHRFLDFADTCIISKMCPALSWDQALLSYSWVNRFQAGKVNRKDSHLVQYLCTYRLWQCQVLQSCLICRSCTGLYPGPTSFFFIIYMNNLPNVLELELRPQSGRNKINLLLTPKRHILQ